MGYKVAISTTQSMTAVHKETGVRFYAESESYHKLNGKLDILVGRFETDNYKVETLPLPKFNFKLWMKVVEWHFAKQLSKVCKKQLEKDLQQ